ncbi:MAG: hypothetical protein ORN83_10645 [Chthoniobacteraceae bacterium]|nr:hypothetical protein [Chthoniobacteraceae bacterium]
MRYPLKAILVATLSCILAIVIAFGWNWQSQSKIRLVFKSVHAGDTEQSVIKFAESQGWYHEKFPKADREHGLFATQDYAYSLRLYEKSRRNDFEAIVAFDSAGKVVNGGITMYYLSLLNERATVMMGRPR